ncbi:MAG TPA: phosphoribosylanthranilate isomerase [Gemmatimonadaceae bacterium]
MAVEIKFCGLTRAQDAAHAGALGAAYAGVVFAGGPRRIDAGHAAEVLSAAGSGVKRVGVFGDEEPDEVARMTRMAGLQVVQLHHHPTPEFISRVRGETGASVWAVVRVSGATLARDIAELDSVADAILLDTLLQGRLGGTGVSFDWSILTPEVRPRSARLVAAGGLTAHNVGEAIRMLAPDIVDVSSGVESAPGIKDHERMRAFADAVHSHDQGR